MKQKAFYAFQSQWNHNPLYLKETRFSVTVGDVMWVILFFFFFPPDTDGIKQEEPEAEKRLAVKDRRRGRKERRSTGLVQPDAEVAHTASSPPTAAGLFGFRSDHKQQFDRGSALQSRNNTFPLPPLPVCRGGA